MRCDLYREATSNVFALQADSGVHGECRGSKRSIKTYDPVEEEETGSRRELRLVESYTSGGSDGGHVRPGFAYVMHLFSFRDFHHASL